MNPAKLNPGAPVRLNTGMSQRRLVTRKALGRLEASLGVSQARALWEGPWVFEGWKPADGLARVRSGDHVLEVHHQDLRAAPGAHGISWRRGPQVHPIATRAALLQALVEGPACGIVLIARVARYTEGVVELDQGGVYPALRAMEARGLTEAVDGPMRGGRPQRIHTLTAKGLERARRDRALMTALMAVPLPGAS